MFGMVLAIGIIVDDAIVVVENVERIMAEEGLPPKEATEKAMKEITGAVVGITLVLTRRVYPNGDGQRFGRGDLPAVHLVDGGFDSVLSVPGVEPDACTLCHLAEAGEKRPSREKRFLWLV